MRELNYDYVSDEENGSENGAWVVRSPQWRSERATKLMRLLQARVDQKADLPRNRRLPGPSSTRRQPRSSVAWALAQER